MAKNEFMEMAKNLHRIYFIIRLVIDEIATGNL